MRLSKNIATALKARAWTNYPALSRSASEAFREPRCRCTAKAVVERGPRRSCCFGRSCTCAVLTLLLYRTVLSQIIWSALKQITLLLKSSGRIVRALLHGNDTFLLQI